MTTIRVSYMSRTLKYYFKRLLTKNNSAKKILIMGDDADDSTNRVYHYKLKDFLMMDEIKGKERLARRPLLSFYFSYPIFSATWVLHFSPHPAASAPSCLSSHFVYFAAKAFNSSRPGFPFRSFPSVTAAPGQLCFSSSIVLPKPLPPEVAKSTIFLPDRS